MTANTSLVLGPTNLSPRLMSHVTGTIQRTHSHFPLHWSRPQSIKNRLSASRSQRIAVWKYGPNIVVHGWIMFTWECLEAIPWSIGCQLGDAKLLCVSGSKDVNRRGRSGLSNNMHVFFSFTVNSRLLLDGTLLLSLLDNSPRIIVFKMPVDTV